MSSFPNYSKTIAFNAGEGVDQKGQALGKPLPGDRVKVHVAGFYTAERPLLLNCCVKPRKTEFLSTHTVGETCFVEVTIPKTPPSAPVNAIDILAVCIETMALGEGATFEFDWNDMDPKIQNMFTSTKLHPRAHYGSIASDSINLIFEVASFRIVRANVEHRRKSQNGTGARMPGSFSMGM